MTHLTNVDYFECHVTIEPVFDDRLTDFTYVANQYGFRVADLLMVKGPGDAGAPSQKDSFCTGRGPYFDGVRERMHGLVRNLRLRGFKVYRAKIEAVVLDERYVPA